MKAIVIGAGKVGFETAKRLSEEEHDVVVIDKDAEVLAELGGRLDVMTLQGSGANPAILDQAGIAGARLVIAVTEIDEVNMIACMTAKQYGVETCVARIRNPDYFASNPRRPLPETARHRSCHQSRAAGRRSRSPAFSRRRKQAMSNTSPTAGSPSSASGWTSVPRSPDEPLPTARSRVFSSSPSCARTG